MNCTSMELRMFEYRLYPSIVEKERIINSLKVCKIVYNDLLDTTIKTYADSGTTLRKFDYNKLIKGKYDIHSQVAQNVSDRVHKAFSNFFRRIKDKSCKQKGFPRFKSRVQSITYPQSGFKFISSNRLYVSKIGNIPIVLHRVPKGKIKTLTIKQNHIGQWFAIFSCEVDIPVVEHANHEMIGIDVGIENFATLSNGEVIVNPRFLVKSEERLKRLHRRLSRTVKGSSNRCKAKFRLAKLSLKVANQRRDFIHKTAKTLTSRFSIIKRENLTIKNMVRNHCLAKSISDASWNSLFQCLSYKAVTCGGRVETVSARNTSKQCSGCGTIIAMPLSKRKFLCPKCNLSIHRDLNASINIRNKNTVGLTEI